jgi:hypothetical protein
MKALTTIAALAIIGAAASPSRCCCRSRKGPGGSKSTKARLLTRRLIPARSSTHWHRRASVTS